MKTVSLFFKTLFGRREESPTILAAARLRRSAKELSDTTEEIEESFAQQIVEFSRRSLAPAWGEEHAQPNHD